MIRRNESIATHLKYFVNASICKCIDYTSNMPSANIFVLFFWLVCLSVYEETKQPIIKF